MLGCSRANSAGRVGGIGADAGAVRARAVSTACCAAGLGGNVNSESPTYPAGIAGPTDIARRQG